MTAELLTIQTGVRHHPPSSPPHTKASQSVCTGINDVVPRHFPAPGIPEAAINAYASMYPPFTVILPTHHACSHRLAKSAPTCKTGTFSVNKECGDALRGPARPCRLPPGDGAAIQEQRQERAGVAATASADMGASVHEELDVEHRPDTSQTWAGSGS